MPTVAMTMEMTMAESSHSPESADAAAAKTQEEQQRTAELPEQDPHPRQCLMLAKLVWSVLAQAFGRVGG